MRFARIERAPPFVPPVWALRGDDQAVADFIAARIRADRECFFAMPPGLSSRRILQDLAGRRLPWNRATLYTTDESPPRAGERGNSFNLLAERFRLTAAWLAPLTPGLVPPRFDLTWLGMDSDGRIASLSTPDCVAASPAPAVCKVTGQRRGELPASHLALNPAALLNAEEIIIVIRGARERSLLERAVRGQSDLPLTHLLRSTRRAIRIFWTA